MKLDKQRGTHSMPESYVLEDAVFSGLIWTHNCEEWCWYIEREEDGYEFVQWGCTSLFDCLEEIEAHTLRVFDWDNIREGIEAIPKLVIN